MTSPVSGFWVYHRLGHPDIEMESDPEHCPVCASESLADEVKAYLRLPAGAPRNMLRAELHQWERAVGRPVTPLDELVPREDDEG